MLLYADPSRLDPVHNTAFLRRCVVGFRRVNFADHATGRIYLRIESGVAVSINREALAAAAADTDTLAGLRAVAPGALVAGAVAASQGPMYLARAPARHRRPPAPPCR